MNGATSPEPHERALAQAQRDAEDARARLRLSERRFAAFLNGGPFLAFLRDSEGRYVTYNDAFARLFGISATAWIGKTDADVLPAQTARIFRENDRRVAESQQPAVLIEHMRNPDGSQSTWRTFRFPCPAEDGSTCIGGFALDITRELAREAELQRSRTELKQANRRLTELATTDPLTGIANRRVFEERLELEFARARRKQRSLAILMLDVDNFKRRNDTYGHDDGDQVLRRLASLLHNTVRVSDLAARYGGEEFVILLPEADEPQAMIMASRILDGLRAEPWPHEPVEISIGAAAIQAEMSTPQRLVICADEALYAAKRAGKNRAAGYRTSVASASNSPKAEPPLPGAATPHAQSDIPSRHPGSPPANHP